MITKQVNVDANHMQLGGDVTNVKMAIGILIPIMVVSSVIVAILVVSILIVTTTRDSVSVKKA